MDDDGPEQAALLWTGDRWTDPITAERQMQLNALANQQRKWAEKPATERGASHFQGVRLTGAEVFWLAAYMLAGSEGNSTAVQERLRASREDRSLRFALSLAGLHLETLYVNTPPCRRVA